MCAPVSKICVPVLTVCAHFKNIIVLFWWPRRGAPMCAPSLIMCAPFWNAISFCLVGRTHGFAPTMVCHCLWWGEHLFGVGEHIGSPLRRRTDQRFPKYNGNGWVWQSFRGKQCREFVCVSIFFLYLRSVSGEKFRFRKRSICYYFAFSQESLGNFDWYNKHGNNRWQVNRSGSSVMWL